MTISVRCPQCGTVHNVGPEMRGKRAKCRCGKILEVPQAPPKSVPRAAPGTAKARKPAAPAGSPPGTGPLQVRCPGCGRVHQASPSMAGTSARCSCGAVLRIPAGRGRQRAAAPASGVASLLNELTEKDIQRIVPAAEKPQEPQGPTQDEVLRRYVGEMPKGRRAARRPNQKLPVGGIILGVLELFPGLLALLAAAAVLFALVMISIGAGQGTADVAGGDVALVILAIILTMVFYAAMAAGFLYSAFGLFTGRSFGWWFTLWLTAIPPVRLVVGVVFAILFALVEGLQEDLSAIPPAMVTLNAIVIVVTLFFVLISVGVAVYLLQRHVMEYYEIETSRAAAIGTALALAVVYLGLLVGGYLGVVALKGSLT